MLTFDILISSNTRYIKGRKTKREIKVRQPSWLRFQKGGMEVRANFNDGTTEKSFQNIGGLQAKFALKVLFLVYVIVAFRAVVAGIHAC